MLCREFCIKSVKFGVALPDALEELVPVENEDAMDFAAETSADGVAEAITHVGDLVDKMVAEAERKAELALEDWVLVQESNLL